MKTITVLCVVVAISVQLNQAAPLTEGTFTEIIKAVELLPAGATAASPAKLKDLVKMPDRVRTGAESRAELTAADQTITRIGANTVFSFESKGRVLNLEKGSLLFHAPKGAGGGTIKSGGASAAVLGTTLVVVATENGGFKVIVLEGKGKATLPNGKSRNLKAGQMVYVLPGGRTFSSVLNINLGKLVGGSQLVNGFSRELPSFPLITAAIQKQNEALAQGRAVDTGVAADDFATSTRPRNGMNAIDPNSYQTAVHPPISSAELFQLIFPSPGGETSPGQTKPAPPGSGIVVISGPPRLSPGTQAK